MARKAFYSFHYVPDNWRAAKVRNIGVVEGNQPASDNDWETVTKGGKAVIEKWIDGQLNGKSVVIVLIGAETAGRKWIEYEIRKAWADGKGILGIRIHNIDDCNGKQCAKGKNPFSAFTIAGKDMSTIVKTYDPPYATSANVYGHIKDNMTDWIETAISIRGDYA